MLLQIVIISHPMLMVIMIVPEWEMKGHSRLWAYEIFAWEPALVVDNFMK